MSRLLVILSLISLALVACAQGQTTIQPPAIHYGEDLCAECNMIISDPRFACGYLHEISPGRYASLIFDDIGDMLASHPEQQIVAWYVHDYTTEEWLDATQAFYVISSEIPTPMAHGIAAHATAAAAQQMATATHGQMVDWAALLTLVK
jgi:copper chaperone NosL